ncbi:MAG: hypothetical protein Q4D96_09280 [Propionibacteriaceae bacterium]|nr:hypothetical protein [Propionibacteriaceae bacterium]
MLWLVVGVPLVMTVVAVVLGAVRLGRLWDRHAREQRRVMVIALVSLPLLNGGQAWYRLTESTSFLGWVLWGLTFLASLALLVVVTRPLHQDSNDDAPAGGESTP